MFNFGWGELVVIGIVALIAIGPKELPTVLRSLGHWMGKIRRMASEFQGQFHEAIREAELTDLKKQAEEMTSGMTNFDPLGDTQKDVERALELPDLDKPQETKTEPPPATETAAAAGDASSAAAKESATPSPAAPPLPAIDVPMPDLPPPVTEKDFAAAEPPPPGKPKNQSGGSA